MARDHARVYLSIWDDDDFRALSPAAQHMYFVLVTSPEMNYAGVTDWRPNRLSKRAGSWTPGAVEIAAQELSECLYIVVDIETEEVLLRSLIRHDGLLEQPNMAVAVRKAWAAVASPDLRAVIIHELNRLHSDKPELKGWSKIEELLSKPSLDPSTRPSFHPSDNPSVDPSEKGSVNPSVGHTRNPSVDPSEKGSPITAPNSSSQLPTPDPQLEVSNLGGDRYETLGLADATKPPTCSKHPNGDHDGPCAGCARVREYGDKLEARAKAEALERAKGCQVCEGMGFILDGTSRLPTRRKCNHVSAVAS